MEIPENEGFACGGARAGPNCAARFPGGDPDGWAPMQGSAYGEAFPDAPGRMRALWYSTVLAGDIPGVGRCVMRYEEDPPSTVSIQSRSGSDNDFFPADATQTLHYRMTVVDADGNATRELAADRPMVMRATIDSIPPLGVGFEVEADIVFSDRATSEPVVILRGGSEGRVLAGVPIELQSEEPRGVAGGGTIDLTVSAPMVRSLTPDAAPVYWSITTHGLDTSDDLPVLTRADAPVRVTGTRSGDGVGMVVVHAFQFGTAEETLLESHVVRRV